MVVALPITLVINFGLMKVAGFSLNTFSLGGLVVARLLPGRQAYEGTKDQPRKAQDEEKSGHRCNSWQSATFRHVSILSCRSPQNEGNGLCNGRNLGPGVGPSYPCQPAVAEYIVGLDTLVGPRCGRLWMGQACEICGKSARVGNQVTTRGRAKYLGGVGTKITGISRRTFKPNLRRVRITTENGAHKTVSVCAQCLRSGAVTRVIHVAPFRAPTSEKAKAGGPKAAVQPAEQQTATPYVPPEGAKVRKRRRKKEEPAG